MWSQISVSGIGAASLRRRCPIAITLESLEDGEWTAVRLWDNADGTDEHHAHEYTRAGGKQSPAILEFRSPNEAMAAAIRKAKAGAPEIVRQWRES